MCFKPALWKLKIVKKNLLKTSNTYLHTFFCVLKQTFVSRLYAGQQTEGRGPKKAICLFSSADRYMLRKSDLFNNNTQCLQTIHIATMKHVLIQSKGWGRGW